MNRWATFIFVAFIAAVLLALTGCAGRTGDVDTAPIRPVVYRDSETGCEYLSTGNFYELTPRMDRDGKQVCR